MTQPQAADSGVVWKGRPSIEPYVALYGVLAAVGIAVLVGLEVWAGFDVAGASFLRHSVSMGGARIPYPVEIATAVVILAAYLVKVVRLVIVRLENSYELRNDGLYFNRGIANLSDTFLSPMAFSDARLVRTIGMRIVGRSLIVIEANDGRRFELKMIKDGLNVQALIRRNMAHPTVRIEGSQPPR
jgi:hypothetical protein